MAVQQRNDEMVDILSADFPRTSNPRGYWHGHRQSVPAGLTFVIPAGYVVVVDSFEIETGATLEIESGGVLMILG